MPYEAGAGRGMRGGPTAKELQDYEDMLNAGIFTAEKLPKSRMAPRDLMPEDLPSPPRGQEVSASKAVSKVARKAFAKGGSIKMRRFADGGDVLEELNQSENLDTTPGPKVEEEKPKTFKEAFAEARRAGDKTFTWNGKKYGTELAGAKASAVPVPGRPRGESEPPSVTKQMADRAAKDTENARSAYEARAAKAREAEAEMARETRGKMIDRKKPILSTKGLDPNTLLPIQMKKGGAVKKYAKGGSVSSASSRADGCAMRGKTRGKVY